MSGIFELRGYVGNLRLANMGRQGDRMRSADVRLWHETVMPVLSPQVRYEDINGPSSVAVRGQSLTRIGR